MKRSKYFGSWEYEEQYIQKDTKMAGNIQSRQKKVFSDCGCSSFETPENECTCDLQNQTDNTLCK